MNQNGRYGTASTLKLCLEDGATHLAIRVSLWINNGFTYKQDGIQEGINTFACLRGQINGLDVSTVSLWKQFIPGEVCEDAIRIACWEVALVDRNDDRYAGFLGNPDGFLGLWHDRVIGCDDNHNDVRDRCTPRTHR